MIERPLGQHVNRLFENETVIFRPTKALDYELELAAVIGRLFERSARVSAHDTTGYIFGFVLLNNWSSKLPRIPDMFNGQY